MPRLRCSIQLGQICIIRLCVVIIFLTRIEDATFDDEGVRKQIEGEARFVRALIYFDLVRYFRGVPIVDKPLTISEAYSVTRATEEEVYDFIISDLKAAIGLLPDVKPKELPNRRPF